MDIISSVTTWAVFVILQITPVHEMTTYNSSIYMGSEMIIETRVVEIPAEDYWVVSTEFLDSESNEILSQFEAGGFFDGEQNQLFSLKEIFGEDSYQLYSVNEMGMPLPLSLKPGPKTSIYMNAEYALPYQGLDIYEFMGGKDKIHHYSDGSMDVFITEKIYNDNPEGTLTEFTIKIEEIDIDFSFHIYFANEG